MSEQSYPDEYYLDMIRAGEVNKGLESLWREYQNDLIRYCKKLCWKFNEPETSADDIASETWLEFVPYIKKAEVKKSVKALLMYLAYTRACHIYRRRRHERLFENDIPDDEEIDERLTGKLDMQAALDDPALVGLLSPCQRIAVILRYKFDLPPRTIHKLMGNSTSVISVSIRQAEVKMQKYLHSEDYSLGTRKSEQTTPRAELFAHPKFPDDMAGLAKDEANKFVREELFDKKDRSFNFDGYFILPTNSLWRNEGMYYVVNIHDNSKFIIGMHDPDDFRDYHLMYDLHIAGKDFHLSNMRSIVIHRYSPFIHSSVEQFKKGIVHWKKPLLVVDLYSHETEKITPAIIAQIKTSWI